MGLYITNITHTHTKHLNIIYIYITYPHTHLYIIYMRYISDISLSSRVYGIVTYNIQQTNPPDSVRRTNSIWLANWPGVDRQGAGTALLERACYTMHLRRSDIRQKSAVSSRVPCINVDLVSISAPPKCPDGLHICGTNRRASVSSASHLAWYNATEWICA